MSWQPPSVRVAGSGREPAAGNEPAAARAPASLRKPASQQGSGSTREPISSRLPKGVLITLHEHLTLAALEAELKRATSAIHSASDKVVLTVDCRTMHGYDGDARARFVQWNSQHRNRIRCVAVITHKALWHMVVGAMAIASGQKMKAFEHLEQVTPWALTID